MNKLNYTKPELRFFFKKVTAAKPQSPGLEIQRDHCHSEGGWRFVEKEFEGRWHGSLMLAMIDFDFIGKTW